VSIPPDAALIIFVTVPDVDAGARLGRALVEERLAACTNIIPGLRSIYLWKGAVEDTTEVLCLIKTRRELLGAVEKRIKELHPYDVPEILGVAPSTGNEPYLRWLGESTLATEV
jgi:periplasmic divalent cation tolerance protein